MGFRQRFAGWLYNTLGGDAKVKDLIGSSVRWRSAFVNDEDVLQSSDVYELLQDIANQVALATPVVIDPNGNEVKQHHVLDVLKQPNQYLTGSEYSALETSNLLLFGEVFPVYLGDELHLVNGVYSQIDDHLIEHYSLDGSEIPGTMIEHIKRIGARADKGQGLVDLGRNTLEGVMNAEKVLTDKYRKGGLLAFLLKLETQINPKNTTQSSTVKAIQGQLEGIDNEDSVKIIPLGKGFDLDTMKSPVEDDKILAYLNVYKKDLGKYLGLNVDTYQNMMKTNIEQAMMYLQNKAVKPILENRSEHYSRLFFGTHSKWRVEWRVNVLDFVSYSTKTNIGYNIVRTGITSPDNVAKMLGFEPQNTPETQAIYISNDLTKIADQKATDDSLPTNTGDKPISPKGGENDAQSETSTNA